VLVACTPATARVLTRRRRWRAARRRGDAVAAEAAWAELGDSARDLGVRVPRDSTPRQYAERLAASSHLADTPRAALARLAQRTERARYAPQRPLSTSSSGNDASGDAGHVAADAAHVDVATVVSAMAAGVGRRRRVLARALPASTTRLLHLAGERLADGLDWLDAAGAAVRRRFLPRRRTT
jgi:hypothetical protein